MQKNATVGFTLIEMLLVVAIIGILAGMLVPALLGAKAKAHNTHALSCANALGRQAIVYEIDTKKLMKVAKPDLSIFIKEGETYYARECTPLTSLKADSVQLRYDKDGDYHFEVKHPAGSRTYDISIAGLFAIN